MKCLEDCRKSQVPCKNKECRLWIDYKKDLNCTNESVKRHGAMTLREASRRLNISFVRVKQIEDKALKKLIKFANKMDI